MTTPLARRPGFTLVETLVALALFQIAMLALVATAGVAARDLAEAMWRRRAQMVVRNRVEMLRSLSCAAPVSGAATRPDGLREAWTVELSGSGRFFRDRVEAPLPRGGRLVAVARGATLCVQ